MATPKNYENLPVASDYVAGDERVGFYMKKGVGKYVAVPGAAGLGSGVSHYVYRVPKSELISVEQMRKIQKNEYNTKMASEAQAKEAANLVRKGEMNLNVAGIVYTDEPMTTVDVDLPINLESLADIAYKLARANVKYTKKEKAKVLQNYKRENPENINWHIQRHGQRYSKLPSNDELYDELGLERYLPIKKKSIDDIIEGLKNKFIETEREKVRDSAMAEARTKFPNWSNPMNYYMIQQMQHGRQMNSERIIQEHIARKMPKIEAVLAKLREGMIMGFPTPAPKAVEKEENLLRFQGLSNINFSSSSSALGAGAGSTYVDPFEGLNADTKNITHADFVEAGVEIEPELVEHFSQNQLSSLLLKLSKLKESEHNAAINSFIENTMGKGRNITGAGAGAGASTHSTNNINLGDMLFLAGSMSKNNQKELTKRLRGTEGNERAKVVDEFFRQIGRGRAGNRKTRRSRKSMKTRKAKRT